MKNGLWHEGKLLPSDAAVARVLELSCGSTAQDDLEAETEITEELNAAYRLDVDPVIDELVGALNETQRRYDYSLDQFAQLYKDCRDAEEQGAALRAALAELETHIIARHRLSDFEAHQRSLQIIRSALGKPQQAFSGTAPFVSRGAGETPT